MVVLFVVAEPTARLRERERGKRGTEEGTLVARRIELQLFVVTTVTCRETLH